ncbi:MAG: hypothetical protein KGJ13_11270, partial [Patescibacteria group bacterium]|nr:hypothetical protein [Patescibacteria group bacterium]
LLVSLLGAGSWYLTDICIHAVGCLMRTILWDIALPIINPGYAFFIWALAISVVLVFVSKEIFISWLKFAAWYLPLMFLSIALTPVSYTGIGIDLYPYYRINAAHDAGVAFVVLSLLLIAWKYWRLHRKSAL